MKIDENLMIEMKIKPRGSHDHTSATVVCGGKSALTALDSSRLYHAVLILSQTVNFHRFSSDKIVCTLHWNIIKGSSKGFRVIISSFYVECVRSFPCFTIDIYTDPVGKR